MPLINMLHALISICIEVQLLSNAYTRLPSYYIKTGACDRKPYTSSPMESSLICRTSDLHLKLMTNMIAFWDYDLSWSGKLRLKYSGYSRTQVSDVSRGVEGWWCDYSGIIRCYFTFCYDLYGILNHFT